MMSNNFNKTENNNSIVWLLFMIKGQFTYLINPNICITRWQWRWQLYKKHFKIFLLCTTFQACFCLLLFTLTGISQQFLLTFPVQGQVSAQLISRLTSFPVSTKTPSTTLRGQWFHHTDIYTYTTKIYTTSYSL